MRILYHIIKIKQNKIESLMILGGGLVGRRVAKLLEKEVDIVLIENNSERAEELADDLKNTQVVQGDGTDANILVTDLLLQIRGNLTNHQTYGSTMSKYLERMAKSNDQILKLAELLSKEEQEKFIIKFGLLDYQKAKTAKLQKINKEILSNATIK